MAKRLLWIGGTGAAVLFISSQYLACNVANEAITPPARTSARISPQHRVVFERDPGGVRSVETDKLVHHGVLSDPSVIYDNERYRMWFTSVTRPHSKNQEMGTAYAESDNGLVWKTRLKPDGDPELLVRPTPGGWDAGGVETPSVVRGPDGKYLLFYSGDLPPKGSHAWAIGLAVSDDGLTWTKVGTGPVLEGRGGWEGPFTEGNKKTGGVGEPSVLYDSREKQFKMWYSGLGMVGSDVAFRIGYATSLNGRNWTRRQDPVFVPEKDSWDDAVTSHVNVVQDPRGGYHMFYFGTSRDRYALSETRQAVMITGAIGHAYSSDGISWQRDANPVLNIEAKSWQAWMVGGPSALIRNNEIRLWYFGSALHDRYEFKIGHARANLSNK